MTRYLGQRVLLAVPTFFGITLVTFLIIHLAPGSPIGGDRPVPQDVIDQIRRLYGLDLPLFLNLHVKDRRHLIGEDIERLGAAHRSHDDSAALIWAGRLRRRGTVAVPDLYRARAVPGVEDVLRCICADHARLCPKGDLVALRGAAEHPEPRAGYGTAAVAGLMARVRAGPEAERRRAVAELARISESQSSHTAHAPPADYARALVYWEDLWIYGEREYREFHGLERATRSLTETQYAKWLRRILSWNLGTSLRSGRPVADLLAERLPRTMLLASLALFFAYLAGVPLGVWSAARRGSSADRAVTVGLFLLYSMPSFWVASMLILLFGGVGFLDWLPIAGICPPGAETLRLWDRCLSCAPSLVLPVTCLTYGSIAVVSRYQRAGLLDVMGQDFIRTARAKGLNERTVRWRHALRNALIPVITLLGLQVPVLLGGSVIVERIFGIPGMGQLAFESIEAHDYPTVMGTTVLAGLLTMASVLLADVLYAVVDPRIGYGRR